VPVRTVPYRWPTGGRQVVSGQEWIDWTALVDRLEGDGLIDDAVEQAAAAGATGRVIELIDRHWLAYVHAGRVATVQRWLALLDGQVRARPAGTRPAARAGAPLTKRERTVLRMLQGSLSLAQIAGELYVSANTVKTHTRGIYLKLGVSSRRDAVRRAHEFGLL
jgi:ATP/maltotriose-dependent transcriptional regulator MalT